MIYHAYMVVNYDSLADIRARHQDKKIILTSGTFDLFHIGHLRYLQAAKSYGDILVIILSGDARVRARKGLERPIIPENERAEILAALEMVDYVFIDPAKYKKDQVDPIHTDIVNGLQPDLYVNDGEDIRFFTVMDKSKLVILPRKKGGSYGSTTNIIKHISDMM